MDIPMQATVYCTDGSYGCSTRIILNPKSRQVTHIVIKEGKRGIERMAPLRFVKESTPEAIYLSCDLSRARRFNSFMAQDYILGDKSGYREASRENYTAVLYEQIPPGEIGLRQDAQVKAKDGKVGSINKLAVDPTDGHITHLGLREGQIWSKKEAAIEISKVEDIQEKAVYLTLNKQEVSQLPAMPLQRSKKQPAR